MSNIIEKTLIEDSEDFKSSWHFCEIRVDRRDELSVWLKNNGINTGVHYKPIHLYKCYGNRPVLPVAEEAFKKILTLPVYPGLKKREAKYIVEKINEFYERGE